MIAGTGSGCGKTTVTCAVLSALHQRGIRVSAFKCGPDYIDPMFYKEILRTPSHNLDSFFCSRDMLCCILDQESRNAEIAVLEGVMGFYDGAEGSAYSISEITETPVILVINCRGMKESLGAVMKGFLEYQKPNLIIGFLFNQLPERLIPFARQLCSQLHTAYFGCLPPRSDTLKSRHLGLVTAAEITDIRTKMDELGTLAAQNIALDSIMQLECPPIPAYQIQPVKKLRAHPVIAAARDKAFCFLYEENLTVLRELGCEIRFFSPLTDDRLPKADGLLLCGGYPELYAKALSENTSMRNAIRTAIQNRMPVIAECGGFMYLHDELQTESGAKYPMAGVIHGTAFPTKQLRRFGYITMQAQTDSMICAKGSSLKAHEFHYWDSTDCGTGMTAQKPDGRTWPCCHVSDTMYAGFPHLYFPSDIQAAYRFASACAAFGGSDGTDTAN